MDHVDHILAQWAIERPDLDVAPMGVIGRLSRAVARVQSQLDATFTRHGIDSGTFDVLATLTRQGAPYRITPAQLAEDAMVTSSAVAQRLNRLEALGLIRRLPHPEDRRGKLVELTSAGAELVDSVLPDHLATEEDLLSSLSAEERRTLASLLGRVGSTTG
ncbi:MarR family winged helix-turn-helix transcriptional regulator [Labedella endophytica]|jgi:DNA-binding MarR family transcriptional regulator|uniref:MarR family transcriptional regulator n=1 Tax=Labedella endophytica TaxID=1523160 RepID=A0A3S0X4P1_9MICO|nr:MarR family transcriptional regulator [Labedella endophytica]RUQ98123.1 MarR family transcriptional regulator [Labedella endophytica]